MSVFLKNVFKRYDLDLDISVTLERTMLGSQDNSKSTQEKLPNKRSDIRVLRFPPKDLSMNLPIVCGDPELHASDALCWWL